MPPFSISSQNTNFGCISSLTSPTLITNSKFLYKQYSINSALSANVIANVCLSTPEKYKFQKENQTEEMQPFQQPIKTEPNFESPCSFSPVNSPLHKQVKSWAKGKGSRSQVAQNLYQGTPNKQLYASTKSDDQVNFIRLFIFL